MISRLTFLAIVAFWVVMNILLWRAEYGPHGGEIPVPLELVWKKILTAPDPSSLSVYQHGERSGFCEFSTSVEQEMAKLDVDKPPPEGIVARAGYQIHLGGNMSLGDFTNRLKFDGRIEFNNARAWREFNLKVSLHQVTIEIHSLATNQTTQVIVTSDGMVEERNFTFTDLQNPQGLMHEIAGDYGAEFLAGLDLPDLTLPAASHALQWQAHRDRILIGHEPVPVYRLETEVLGRPVIITVSTIGEIMRVELPDNVTAVIDEWSKP